MKGNPDSRMFEIYIRVYSLHSVAHDEMVQNVKFVLEQAMNAQRGSKGITLLFL